MGDFAPADDQVEEIEPEPQDMDDWDWLEKWEVERGLLPHMPFRYDQFAVTVGMDAFRLCIGLKPRNHDAATVAAWIDAMATTCAVPSPFPERR